MAPEGEDVTAELSGFTVTRGASPSGDCIRNDGTLALRNSTVTRCSALGIPSDFANSSGGGVLNIASTLTLTNSTVSGNILDSGNGAGVNNALGTVTLTNSTVSGNRASDGGDIVNHSDATLTLTSNIVDGNCVNSAPLFSDGHNLESPGNTCGFDQGTDQPSVPDPMLGPLQDNGGATMTHALLSGSPAINQIPVEDCLDADGAPLATDQRGEPRPETGGTLCDVGAFERQPEDP